MTLSYFHIPVKRSDLLLVTNVKLNLHLIDIFLENLTSDKRNSTYFEEMNSRQPIICPRLADTVTFKLNLSEILANYPGISIFS